MSASVNAGGKHELPPVLYFDAARELALPTSTYADENDSANTPAVSSTNDFMDASHNGAASASRAVALPGNGGVSLVTIRRSQKLPPPSKSSSSPRLLPFSSRSQPHSPRGGASSATNQSGTTFPHDNSHNNSAVWTGKTAASPLIADAGASFGSGAALTSASTVSQARSPPHSLPAATTGPARSTTPTLRSVHRVAPTPLPHLSSYEFCRTPASSRKGKKDQSWNFTVVYNNQ